MALEEHADSHGRETPPRARPPIEGILRRTEALTLPDGYATSVLRHVPAASGERGAPVLCVHGIQSHPGWYVGSADALAAAGHEVFQVTRRGSGSATRDRGHVRSAGELLADLDAAVDYVLGETGADRVALLGVSWAGKLLIPYAVRSPARVATLTLAAPGLVAKVGPSVWTKLAVAACLVCCPRRRFEIPLNDVALFTDNEAMRDYLRSDTHRLLRGSARLLLATVVLDRLVRRARPGSLAVPTTVLLARRDRIADNAATRRLVDRLSGGRAAYREFDACHTIEFEPDVSAFHAALRQAVDGDGADLD